METTGVYWQAPWEALADAGIEAFHPRACRNRRLRRGGRRRPRRRAPRRRPRRRGCHRPRPPESVSSAPPPRIQSLPRRPSIRLSPLSPASQSLNLVPTKFSMDEKSPPAPSSGTGEQREQRGHDVGLDVMPILDADVLLQRHEGDAGLGERVEDRGRVR